MKNRKIFVLFILVVVLCFVCFGNSMAAECIPEKVTCPDGYKADNNCKCVQSSAPSGKCTSQESCCKYYEPESSGWQEQCSGCVCGGSSSSAEATAPKPKPLPEDGKGAYYLDSTGTKQYVQYKSWNDCMMVFGDASKCGRIVTDECESCYGTCQALLAKGEKLSGSCSVVCKNSCGNRNLGGGVDSVDGNGGSAAGGTDDYGTWYLENGQRKYSNFHDFRGCWSVMGDVKQCIKYGYYCGYKNGFYISYLCNWDDDACIDRVKAEYANACN